MITAVAIASFLLFNFSLQGCCRSRFCGGSNNLRNPFRHSSPVTQQETNKTRNLNSITINGITINGINGITTTCSNQRFVCQKTIPTLNTPAAFPTTGKTINAPLSGQFVGQSIKDCLKLNVKNGDVGTTGGSISCGEIDVASDRKISTTGGAISANTISLENESKIETNGGQISANTISAEKNAAISTNGGSIYAKRVSNAAISTNGGSINVAGDISNAGIMETNGGSIYANDITPTENIKTNGGSFCVQNILAEENSSVNITTEGGDVHVTGNIRVLSIDTRITSGPCKGNKGTITGNTCGVQTINGVPNPEYKSSC